jgi:hypothetical protein
MSDIKIKIDLNNLTRAHLDECVSHLGACQYDAPCIIGTLMSPADRRRLAFEVAGTLEDEIAALVSAGLITIPAEQLKDAKALQKAFDESYWSDLVSVASKYIRDDL